MALLVTVFFAGITPRNAAGVGVGWLDAGLMLCREMLCGLGLGLAIQVVFLAVRQGGRLAGRQMGFALASIIDPATGEQSQPLGAFFETVFLVLFLAAGGHHLLLLIISRSYAMFPVGSGPELGAMVESLSRAGSTMLLVTLRLAAPILAAFLTLSVILGILSRALPEMNILMTSLPLRVGLGLFMAAGIMPLMNSITRDLARWLNGFLVG